MRVTVEKYNSWNGSGGSMSAVSLKSQLENSTQMYWDEDFTWDGNGCESISSEVMIGQFSSCTYLKVAGICCWQEWYAGSIQTRHRRISITVLLYHKLIFTVLPRRGSTSDNVCYIMKKKQNSLTVKIYLLATYMNICWWLSMKYKDKELGIQVMISK